MGNENYVIFEISGIKHNNCESSFSFEKEAICEVSNDRFIEKVEVAQDISKVTFYLNDTLKLTEDLVLQIIEYLKSYLESMIVSLIRNSLEYSHVPLRPTISVSSIQCTVDEIPHTEFSDQIGLNYSVICDNLSLEGEKILRKWIQNVDVTEYKNKKDNYDILFMLLQIKDKIQKYMALYAYLMRLVKEISFTSYESQKQVVQYISEKCSKIGIVLKQSQTTRPGAQPTDRDDQFTMLRNKIAHPAVADEVANVSEIMLNNLAAIICCAIEDLPAKSN